jgi:outer membrane autotransporter protein
MMGSGKSVIIETANIPKDEKIALVFKADEANHQPVNLGGIYYDSLKVDLGLLLTNETKGLAILEGIWTKDLSELYEHLTLQVVKASDGNFAILMPEHASKLPLKKLILGADPGNQKAVLNLMNGDKLGEVSFTGNTDDKVVGKLELRNGSLYVHDGIEVLENFTLEHVSVKLAIVGNDGSATGSEAPENEADFGHYFIGGDVTIPEGVTFTIGGKTIQPLGFDPKPALHGSGDGKVGVFIVRGNLAFTGHTTREPESLGAADKIDNKTKFLVKNHDGVSYHDYIVVEGGTEVAPREIRLNGGTLLFSDGDKDGERILAKINTEEKSQLVLVKEGGYVQIIGSGDGDEGGLKLDLHGVNAKNAPLVRLEKSASVILDPLSINAGNYTAIEADENGNIGFRDTHEVKLQGDVTSGPGLRLTFYLSENDKKAETMFNWLGGNLNLPKDQKVVLWAALDRLDKKNTANPGRKEKQDFLEAYIAKNSKLHFMSLKGNANKDAILAAIDKQVGGLAQGITFEIDADGNLVLNLSNAKVPANLKELLAGDLDTAYLSGGFQEILGRAYELGARTDIEAGILAYIETGHAEVLPAFSKTTTEEKNRMTLTFANSIRETAYSKMGQEFLGDKHYNVWASGFGDLTKNGSSSSFKMNCDIYGFVAGIDWRASNNLLIGALGGYGKAHAKYKGEVQLTNDNTNKGNFESYFGGIYGMWDEFIQDICVKFSLMAGHGKYNEHYAFPLLSEVNAPVMHPSHKGHWISGNIDCTYKHWNLYGVNIGPWVSLSASTVHQKPDILRIGEVALSDGDDGLRAHFERKVTTADRRSIEATIGIAADYDFSAGMLELALGYKHEFRNLKGGHISLREIYDNDAYAGSTVSRGNIAESFKFDAFNVKTGRDSFVARASWNMKFGDFGLSLGGHTQVGNHFRDIAGSITATYAF